MNLGMENETTEHKRSTAELEAAMESVASILNKHDHGELYFGVRPRDGEVIGMGVSEKTLRDISQAFTNRVEPRVYPTTEHLVTEDGKSYVKASFFGTERPYASQGRYRIRSADEDLPMNAETLERMMLECAERKGPWDGHLSGRPVADADEGALRRFVEEGNACGRIAAPYTGAADALAGLGLITDNGTLSNAAAALFCPSRTGAHLKAGILADRSRVEILDLQQWDGPVYDPISRAEFYMLSNIRRLIIDGSPAREEVPEIPRAAFREAIVNALCHRDWTDYGTAVQVDIYPDTVEITNPGTFPAGRTPRCICPTRSWLPRAETPSSPQRCSAPRPSSRSAPASSAFGAPAPRLEYASSTRRRTVPPPCAFTATTPTANHLELIRFQVVPSGSKLTIPRWACPRMSAPSSHFSATAIVRRRSRLLRRRTWAAAAPSSSSADSLSAGSSPQRAPRGRGATALPSAADGASARAADRDGGQ